MRTSVQSLSPTLAISQGLMENHMGGCTSQSIRYIFRLNVSRKKKKKQVFVIVLSFGAGFGQTWIQMSVLSQTNSKPHFLQKHLVERVVKLT